MDELVLRRVVGVITIAIAAFLLSWLLPRPGLDRLRGEGERVVTVDLTRPDARPQELPPPTGQDATHPGAAPEPASDPPAQPASVPAAPEATEPASTAPDSKPLEAGKPTIASAPPASPRTVETPKPAAPAPVPKPPKPIKPAAEAPTASPPSGGGSGHVMVQAGAYSHLDKAESVRERAGAQGQRCTISPAETAKGTLYRLRCGPYADRTQAQAAVKTLTAAGIGAQVVGGAR